MKKKDARFKVRHKGYDREAVESFIADMNEKSESALMAQKERIAGLVKQNEDLSTKLKVYEAREEQIKLTLVRATKTAEELEAEIKRKYKAELDRLKLFRAKWTSAYIDLKERYHFAKDALNMESVAVQTELELTKYLSQEFSLTREDDMDDMEAYFKSEVERLTRVQQNMQSAEKRDDRQITQQSPAVLQSKPAKSAKKSGSKALPSAQDVESIEGQGAFSLDEALHPTESLEELCQSLFN
ncbi:MAG: DivIVA domain-containing protein [Clostridia bacterium]|nr:DivIVA domain-containing protein [Clostridia bacterium]